MGLWPTHRDENLGRVGAYDQSSVDGKDRLHSGCSEAVSELDLERAF